jgi:hypothetical protein
MKKIIGIIILLVLVNSASAHNPQVSSMSIIQNENKKWTVFITAPLSTCQLAIHDNFPNLLLDSINPYKLQDLILNMVKKSISINNNKNFKLINDKIQLAHETMVYFELQHDQPNFMPDKVEFKAFSKLSDHFTVLKIIAYGGKEMNYILSSENGFNYPAINKKEITLSKTMQFLSCFIIIAVIIIAIIFSKKIFLNNTNNINKIKR